MGQNQISVLRVNQELSCIKQARVFENQKVDHRHLKKSMDGLNNKLNETEDVIGVLEDRIKECRYAVQ